MRHVRDLVLLAAGVAIVTSLAGLAAGDTDSLKGKAAPDFTLPMLDGNEAKLSQQKGSVVLLDFWATWCPPCRKSLPHVQKLHDNKEFAEAGLKVWAVNAREAAEKVEAYLKENKLTFAVPLDAQGAAMAQYQVEGIPTTVVVGRDGTVKAVFVGYGPGSDQMIDKAVRAALAEKAG